MTLRSYPLTGHIRKSICFIAMLILIFSCRKESEKAPPSIQLISENGFITDSITVPIGFPYNIGINAVKGDAAITNLVVTLTTENGTETAIDSGMYTENLNYELHVAYGASRFEKWSFTLRDKNGKSANTSVTIWKDTTSAFGPIAYYPAVKLCTQNSLLPGSFFSLSDGAVFTTENAEASQSSVNIITYWGDVLVPSTEFTLSSPGESDVTTFYPMIANWATPHNETRYKTDSLSISHQAFDAAYNDSIIITNYTSATIGKRKFKLVRTGYVIPFQVTIGPATGKRGLIKINSMQNGTDGYIIADIKVQK